MNRAHELTIEELMEVVGKDAKTVSNLRDDKSNVREFLREYGVTDGSTLVPNYKVYFDYCRKWRPQGKKLSKIGFLRKFSVVFESHRKTKVRYYLLDEGVFDISEEAINEAKEFDRRSRNKIRKKNKQKKQDKASRTAKEIQSQDEAGLHRT